MTLRILVLQHVLFEGVGAISTWANNHHHALKACLIEALEQWPEPADFDMLIILGGPMSLHDEALYPWLIAEKHWIQQFLALDRPVLGICLGAQLLAEALGARVYQAREKEIGWFPVQPSSTASQSRFYFRDKFLPFHWHGETFDLPSGAVGLAETPVCKNQAFIWGDRVVGLQFHLEATPETIETLVKAASHEIGVGTYQQTPETILGLDHLACPANQELFQVLDYLSQFSCIKL